jgi:uncharacterized protein YegP (UPF0339 family)
MKRRDKLEFLIDATGEHRWRVTAGNGAIIDASSEGFASKFNAKRNYRRVRAAIIALPCPRSRNER